MRILYGYFIGILFIFTGCVEKIYPSFTYKTTTPIDKNTTTLNFEKHFKSQINVESGKVIRLNLDEVFVASDDESDGWTNSKDSIANREFLVYAKIYKNGIFTQYKNLVHVSEHMSLFNPMVINDTNIFTETINSDNYRIELKVYEVDTSSVVKTLRLVKNNNLEALEGKYAPGDSFMTGVKEIVIGLFDSIAGLLSGRTVDDLAAISHAEPILEHSIYITPTTREKDNITAFLLVGGNGSINESVYNIEQNSSKNINQVNYDSYENIDNKFLNTVKGNISISKIRNGTAENINLYPYVFITIDRLDIKDK